MNHTVNNRINRINYIVQENPSGVSQLLVKEGFQPTNDLNTLIQQTKQWIREDGKSAVVKLLTVHPEKDAILSANKDNYDNYGGCGCKSSFDGTPCGCKSYYNGSGCPCQAKSSYNKDYKNGLEDLSRKELQQRYKELKRLLKKFPEDQELHEEVELVWEELSSRKKMGKEAVNRKSSGDLANENQKAVFTVNAKDLAVGSLIFGLALIISQVK